MSEQSEDTTLYQVVINDKEQYSLLPADRAVPGGWRPAGKEGTKTECLDYIHEIWSGTRPGTLPDSTDAGA
jgi:MbtH protein